MSSQYLYVGFSLLVLALANTLLHTLAVISRVAAGLLEVHRRYLQVVMTRRRVQVSDVLLSSSNGPLTCLISYLFVGPLLVI